MLDLLHFNFFVKNTYSLFVHSFSFFKFIAIILIFNFLIFVLFFSAGEHAFTYFSWEFISHVLSFIFEFIIFNFALVCLIYSENSGFFLSLSGLMILISGDFFFNYSFLSQTNFLLPYGELLWYLGLILIFFGILNIKINRNYKIKFWFSQANSIKNKLAFWSFGTSISSFLLFFLAAYFSGIEKNLLPVLPLFVMFYSIVVVIFSIYMGKRFEAPFKKLASNVKDLMINNKIAVDNNFSTQEFIFLQDFIINTFKEKNEKDLAKQELLNLATQAAHDIRSPLAAINTVVLDITSVPEKYQFIIRNAVNRINDIANNLLSGSKIMSNIERINDYKERFSEPIYLILESIVSEKRYEHYQSGININLKYAKDSYNSFAKLNASIFKRVLSNLINNSVEAINIKGQNKGQIEISLSNTDEYVQIIVRDNGCGIPTNVIPYITKQGYSYNKQNGAGLGLAFTKQCLEQIKGSLEIASEESKGTTVIIQLLKSEPPAWFCKNIDIATSSIVVILDDDHSIHEIWKERLKFIPELKIIHCFKRIDFLNLKINTAESCLYLVDYRIMDSASGLDIINECGISENCILVTSNFENLDIRKECTKLNIKILPKFFVPHVRITQANYNKINTVVFIDDDKMMRDTWSIAASCTGNLIDTYNSVEQFLDKSDYYNKQTVIYVDSDLDKEIRGEFLAKKIFDKGFTEIYLATGFPKEKIGKFDWIKEVVGKEPPFNVKDVR
ncbi:sensor histidine kinase [Legionella clemsonensis]|uniref:histidine kinase n=1 Tax=Legionella clemsonensis TaxID=1867846 RepID=A0A222NYP5_9GAMM|nr:HAMP domain-containing sensor histidine kinase [Legionella clemsonensis]ASQ44717.1 Sporulation kinase D [Legionella clemsonensis]